MFVMCVYQMFFNQNWILKLKKVFLGYASNKKGYKCLNPVTKRFFESMDVHFVEDQPFFQKNPLQRGT